MRKSAYTKLKEGLTRVLNEEGGLNPNQESIIDYYTTLMAWNAFDDEIGAVIVKFCQYKVFDYELCLLQAQSYIEYLIRVFKGDAEGENLFDEGGAENE